MDWCNQPVIEFAVTTHCQVNCPLCPRTSKLTGKRKKTLPLQHLSFNDYKTVVDQMPSNIIIQLCGDYGDPLMHPDLDNFIEYGIKNSRFVKINTNAGLRDEKWFKNIATTYKNKVSMAFSIDGIDDKTNSKYRIGADFNRVWKNFTMYANNCNWGCVWDFLVFKYNHHQIEEAYNIAKKFPKVWFRPKINSRNWKHTIVNKELKNKLSKYIDEITNEQGIVDNQFRGNLEVA